MYKRQAQHSREDSRKMRLQARTPHAYIVDLSGTFDKHVDCSVIPNNILAAHKIPLLCQGVFCHNHYYLSFGYLSVLFTTPLLA